MSDASPETPQFWQIDPAELEPVRALVERVVDSQALAIAQEALGNAKLSIGPKTDPITGGFGGVQPYVSAFHSDWALFSREVSLHDMLIDYLRDYRLNNQPGLTFGEEERPRMNALHAVLADVIRQLDAARYLSDDDAERGLSPK